ncbi:N-acetyltransferase [Mucilaginibacter sp. RS28]|uniref:N-acetyltransferase n=1 Tax=Mucilaginibacter straminoryzae TaxID=2932774 RepID=A0A9X1X3N4_9SPHI|nr:GNAT family N-acetyltransferase [Mucilaginibacter straminoryzae]MCJ8209515.1 N-acetyltransferase [Mucilaginibacter straminoryzae]
MRVELENKGDDELLFFIAEDSAHIGEMYAAITEPKVITIYHTHVKEAYQGRHLGELLVENSVNYARKNQLRIVPSCSYAQGVFARRKDFNDVLA